MEKLTEATDNRPESLVAPHEVRELIARLSEATVESREATEARTIEGLALNSGIPVAKLREELAKMRGRRSRKMPQLWVFVACGTILVATYFAWPRAKSETISAVLPPAVSPQLSYDTEGLVPLKSVTYGPDSGNVLVDPSFEPSRPLPAGISLATTIQGVMWGNGDHRARALQRPLDPDELERVRSAATELLEYTRKQAQERSLPLSAGLKPGQSTGSGYQVNLQFFTYYGAGNQGVTLPPPGVKDDEAARRIRVAVKKMLETMQDQMKFMQQARATGGPR